MLGPINIRRGACARTRVDILNVHNRITELRGSA